MNKLLNTAAKVTVAAAPILAGPLDWLKNLFIWAFDQSNDPDLFRIPRSAVDTILNIFM